MIKKSRRATSRTRTRVRARSRLSRTARPSRTRTSLLTTRSRVAPRAPAARRARVSRGRDAASSRVRRRGRATVVARGATRESSLSPLVASSRAVRPSVRLARASARRVDESRSAHRVVRTLDGVAPRARVESSTRVDRVERARDRVGRSVGPSSYIHSHIHLSSPYGTASACARSNAPRRRAPTTIDSIASPSIPIDRRLHRASIARAPDPVWGAGTRTGTHHRVIGHPSPRHPPPRVTPSVLAVDQSRDRNERFSLDPPFGRAVGRTHRVSSPDRRGRENHPSKTNRDVVSRALAHRAPDGSTCVYSMYRV